MFYIWKIELSCLLTPGEKHHLHGWTSVIRNLKVMYLDRETLKIKHTLNYKCTRFILSGKCRCLLLFEWSCDGSFSGLQAGRVVRCPALQERERQFKPQCGLGQLDTQVTPWPWQIFCLFLYLWPCDGLDELSGVWLAPTPPPPMTLRRIKRQKKMNLCKSTY